MFGYTCCECGDGIAQETVFPSFEVKFNQVPFTVHDAVIGVCDTCGAQHFSGKEHKRWRILFDQRYIVYRETDDDQEEVVSMSGYMCDECDTGTVRDVVIENLKIHFRHIPFIVPEATVDECNKCGARYYDGREYEKWREMFEQRSEEDGGILSPERIREIRENIGLNETDFAILIGEAKHSIEHWERSDRTVIQSRMADLMIRLVAAQGAAVDFLSEIARQSGVEVSPHALKQVSD